MPFTCFRSPKSWDWSGFQPNIQIQMAFESNIQLTCGQKFTFTEKYVSQVLHNIAGSGKLKSDEKPLITSCTLPANFPTFLVPIGFCRV